MIDRKFQKNTFTLEIFQNAHKQGTLRKPIFKKSPLSEGSQKGRLSSNAKQACNSQTVSDPQQKQRNQSRRCEEKGHMMYYRLSIENLRDP